jgi:hypothetical protein
VRLLRSRCQESLRPATRRPTTSGESTVIGCSSKSNSEESMHAYQVPKGGAADIVKARAERVGLDPASFAVRHGLCILQWRPDFTGVTQRGMRLKNASTCPRRSRLHRTVRRPRAGGLGTSTPASSLEMSNISLNSSSMAVTAASICSTIRFRSAESRCQGRRSPRGRWQSRTSAPASCRCSCA